MRAIEKTTTLSMADAEAAVREGLASQGFGVLTEIDIAAALKAKIGVDRAPLKILGACNPTFAHKALELDESVSLLLPCNVVLAATAPQNSTINTMATIQWPPAHPWSRQSCIIAAPPSRA